MEAEREKPLIIQYNGQPFVLFYGHSPERSGRQFSNFYPSDFQIDTNAVRGDIDLGEFNGFVTLHWSEQYLMLRKALLFRDAAQAVKIIAAESPGSVKNLGRGVKNFDEAVWVDVRLEIMINGLLEKFKDPVLRQYLLDTGDATIVECSPTDKIWGIGLSLGAIECFQRDKWQGLNLLGQALMEVRERINK